MQPLQQKTNIHRVLLFFILGIGISFHTAAETWNEPWQKEILQQSEYFVLAKVISNIDSIGTRVNIIKHFGDQKLTGEILINGFSQLHLTSTSGHGLHMHFEKDQVFYFLLRKSDDGNFAIPTPTSGFAFLDEDKNVTATYRHSYHQALIPQDVYENTYTEIWKYYKSSTFDREKIIPFIKEHLAKKPARFGEDEIAVFFLQHVAMETAYLLDITIELNTLKKFIEYDNSHANISALQLLGNSTHKKTKKYLFNYIIADTNGNFEKVIAIWALRKIGAKKYINKLIAVKDNLSNEDTGFGGNIMDPRVGTYFPSPKSAVAQLKE